MSEVYVSQILLMANTFVPRGWHACDGSLVPINSNQALFALIGTTYGGNGTTTFALPDLRSRIPIGAGAGPGLTSYVLGTVGGTEKVTLTQANLAAHTHQAALQVTASGRGGSPATGNYLETSATVPPSSSPTLVSLAGVTVQPAGNSQPFDVRPPFLALQYCIALQGLFPSRN